MHITATDLSELMTTVRHLVEDDIANREKTFVTKATHEVPSGRVSERQVAMIQHDLQTIFGNRPGLVSIEVYWFDVMRLGVIVRMSPV